MADIWYSVTPKDKVEITRRLNAIEPAYHFNPDETAIDCAPLPFYGDARLLRVFKNHPGTPPFWYVQLPDDLVPLDFSIANIHHMNAAAPLALSPNTVEDYLRFRLYFGDRRVMRRCRADLHDTEWHATVQFAAVDGLYEASLMISPRGEVTESQLEKRGDNGYVTLPEFSFAA
jgi:hypothetical protein